MRILVKLALTLSTPAMADPAAVTDADFMPIKLEEAKLGQLLFYDPILSGNRNISCATCHHPKFGTADGVSLSLGEGGIGLGPDRRADPANMPEQRIPRNAPALFNLGASEFTVMFHDGRIEQRKDDLRTPMGDEMEVGFTSLLSAQTMFPVLSPDEMAGHYSENDVAKAVRTGQITGDGGAWNILSKRIETIPAYAQAFAQIGIDDIHFTDISNVIASFIAHEWRADDSPFDAYLRDGTPLPDAAEKGRALFYGDAGCVTCHSGAFQTDHGFHATGQPQFGPGKAARFETHARDTGRMRVTGQDADAYRFRTPSLRNVTRTAPYGHTGAYPTLETFLTAHNNADAVAIYDLNSAILPTLDVTDTWIMDRPTEIAAIQTAVPTPATELTMTDIEALTAFLTALEDKTALQGRLGIPDTVPSGLPVDR